MSDQTPPTYNPADHLTQLRGKGGATDYLAVADRLVWFRSECPDGQIDMEHIEITDHRAVFRATVRKVTPEGVILGTATGYGSETPGDFADYIEKASTKALGRALAHLGYGTQFVGDELRDGARPRIVDSPVERPTPIRQPPAQPATKAPAGPPNAKPPAPDANLVTPRQLKFLQAIAREAGIAEDMLESQSQQMYRKSTGTLSRQQASALIEWVQQERKG